MRTVLVDCVLVLFVIYRHPSDYPAHWVVRPHAVMHSGAIIMAPIASLCDSLAEARADIPSCGLNIGRRPGDDPAIYEVWV